MTNNDYKTASDIAEAVGLTRQTIYYYEELGLIEPVIKTDKIRLFGGETIDRVKRIRELSKTYKLDAIKGVLDEHRDPAK